MGTKRKQNRQGFFGWTKGTKCKSYHEEIMCLEVAVQVCGYILPGLIEAGQPESTIEFLLGDLSLPSL